MKFFRVLAIIVCTSFSAGANIFDDISECIQNPCNCGCFSKISRPYNPQLLNTIKDSQDCACPPYNRRTGVTSDTEKYNCLNQFSPPKNFTPAYNVFCAEKTGNTNYFSPKIRIRMKTCNLGGCWNQMGDLDWRGECKVWPGAYALPLRRFCARLAVPQYQKKRDNSAEYKTIAADPGYHLSNWDKSKEMQRSISARQGTNGQIDDSAAVLDERGVPENGFLYQQYQIINKEIVTKNASLPPSRQQKEVDLSSVKVPKLCLYDDPGLLTPDLLDIFDYNPVKQPFHKTSQMSVAAEIMLLLLEAPDAMQKGIVNMLTSWVHNQVITDMINTIVTIVTIIQRGGPIVLGMEAAKAYLKAYGQINSSVSNNLGCVDIPIGPYPPPYYDVLKYPPPTPGLVQICPQKANGKIIAPYNFANISKNSGDIMDQAYVSSSGCIQPQDTNKKNIVNNYIDNAVKVAFEDYIPLCRVYREITQTQVSDVDLVSAGECVTDTTIGIPIYGTKYSMDSMTNLSSSPESVVSGMPSCSEGKFPCYAQWGINAGDAKILNITIPEENNNTIIRSQISLKSPEGNNIILYGFIAMQDDEYQDSGNLCVYNNVIRSAESLVGCVKRAPPGNLQITDTNFIPLENFYRPTATVAMQVGSKKLITTHKLLTILDSKDIIDEPINLGGSEFFLYATDDNNQKTPFTGSSSYIPPSQGSSSFATTLFGRYIKTSDLFTTDSIDGKISPKNLIADKNSKYTYLSGLEYVFGKYYRGATQLCISTNNVHSTCPADVDNCVLSSCLIDNNVLHSTESFGDDNNVCVPGDKKTASIKSSFNPMSSADYIRTTASDIDKSKNISEYCGVVENTDPANVSAPTNNMYHFDHSRCNIRNKNSQESGLCKELPPLICSKDDVNNEISNKFLANSAVNVDDMLVAEDVAMGNPIAVRCKPGFFLGKNRYGRCLLKSLSKNSSDVYANSIVPSIYFAEDNFCISGGKSKSHDSLKKEGYQSVYTFLKMDWNTDNVYIKKKNLPDFLPGTSKCYLGVLHNYINLNVIRSLEVNNQDIDVLKLKSRDYIDISPALIQGLNKFNFNLTSDQVSAYEMELMCKYK